MATTMNLFDEFKWRGMLHEATPELHEVLAKEKLTAYIGFDPSAASLHVGSLLPVMALARLQRFGHTPIAIAGGGTGLIGDPSGKTKERRLLTTEQVEENLVGIKEQLSHFLDFDAKDNPARIVNNADWLGAITMMEFLRDVITYLKFFTWLTKEEVDELEQSLKSAPEKREAQRRLAHEVTAMLHGETELAKAERASEVLFGKEMSGLSVDEILDIFADVPSTEIDKSKLESDGFTLSDALVASGLAPSKGEAKRLVQGGGVAVNNQRA